MLVLRDLVLGKRPELFYKQNMKCGAIEASAILTRHGLDPVSTGESLFLPARKEHWRNCMSPLILQQPSVKGCTGLERLLLFLLFLVPLLLVGVLGVPLLFFFLLEEFFPYMLLG